MDKSQFIKSDVQFRVGKRLVCFSIFHNMPNTPGLSFSDALQNWIARTDRYTAGSLCSYIDSKQSGYIAMTEAKYNKLSK